MVILSNSSPTDIGVVIIILGQNTKFKVQSSIGHATEGTDTARDRLIGDERATISKADDARNQRISLRRRPIAVGGEGVPIGYTDISWVL